jgi:hypothetical protein
MGTEERIGKHIDRYKYYRLMKRKMHHKMICEFRTLDKITNGNARDVLKGQIDGELVDTKNLSERVSELAKGTETFSPSCKPKNHSE